MGDGWTAPAFRTAYRYAHQVTAELRQRAEAAEKELDDELGRWQQEIYEQLGKACPGLNIDGAGSDSGDPLDFTRSEIAQVVNYFTDQLATAQARIKELEKDKARLDWCESQSNGSSCIARQSNSGRGFRLHNTGSDDSWNPDCRGNFRDAIDSAMKSEQEE